MKKEMMVITAAFLTGLVLVSCSPESRDSVKELGNDMKRDVNKAAQNVDRAVEDAMD